MCKTSTELLCKCKDITDEASNDHIREKAALDMATSETSKEEKDKSGNDGKTNNPTQQRVILLQIETFGKE